MLFKNVITVGFAVLALGSLVTPTQAQAPAIAKQVKVNPGELSGKILQSGTRAPADGHVMSLRSMDGKEIAKVTTNPNGTYTTPPLEDGQYMMQVADGMNLQLNVAPGANIKSLDIVVPQQALAAAEAPAEVPTPPEAPAQPTAPAAPGGAGAQGAGAQGAGAAGAGTAGSGAAAAGGAAAGGAAAAGGIGMTTVLIVAGGAAVVVGGAIAFSGSSGSDENVVSPSSARRR